MGVVAGSLAFVWEQSKVRWSRRPDWYGSLSDALVRGHDVGVGRIAASVAERAILRHALEGCNTPSNGSTFALGGAGSHYCCRHRVHRTAQVADEEVKALGRAKARVFARRGKERRLLRRQLRLQRGVRRS